MNAKYYLIIPVVLAMFAVPVLATDPYVYPDNPVTFQMSANVTASSIPPVVKIKWELPDESPASGTQFYPNLSGDRTLYGYAVVTDPEGRDNIGMVYFDVFHPKNWNGSQDGQFKYQVHCRKLDPVSDRTKILAKMDEALNHHLIDEAQWTDVYEEIFDVRDAYMYECELPLRYHQPCGKYRIEVWAADTSGATSAKLINYFDYVCTTAVEFDFSNIPFGSLAPGVEKVVPGDFDITTTDRPSLKNEGNTEAKIGLLASPLVGQKPPQPKQIEDFDATFRDENLIFKAGQQVWFRNPLQLCHTEKIVFSVHPPIGIPEDVYSGSMTVFVQGHTPWII